MEDESSRLFRMEFTAHGKVQRVHYRAWTKRAADELRLNGWVRNTPEGSVVGVAEGLERDVLALRERLRTGSPAARVDRLDATLLELSAPLSPGRAEAAEGAGPCPPGFTVDKLYGHALHPPRAPRQPRPGQHKPSSSKGARQAARGAGGLATGCS